MMGTRWNSIIIKEGLSLRNHGRSMSADGDTEFPKVLLKDLLPRDVAAKQLGLDPVDGDQDTVASCD